MTASEPLTLEEEHEMQMRWRDDGDKLTFIVGVREQGGEREAVVAEGKKGTEVESEGKREEDAGQEEKENDGNWVDENCEGKLIGDVNLFISTRETESQSDSESESNPNPSAVVNDGSITTPEILVGELELMIAVPSQQRRGYGRAAVLMLIRYVVEHEAEIVREYLVSRPDRLNQRGGGEMRAGDAGQDADMEETGFEYFEVKIHESNERSIRLFEGIGFERVREEGNYFGELEFRLGRKSGFFAGRGVGEGVEGLLGRWGVGEYQEGRYDETV